MDSNVYHQLVVSLQKLHKNMIVYPINRIHKQKLNKINPKAIMSKIKQRKRLKNNMNYNKVQIYKNKIKK